MPLSLTINHSLSLRDLSNRWITEIFSTEYKFKAAQYLVYQDDIPGKIYIVLDGWANNHKLFEDGRRQIINFVLPGNLIGLQFDETENLPYMVEAITDLRVLGIDKAIFWEKIYSNPMLLRQILRKKEKYQRVLEKRIILLTASDSFSSMAQLLALLYSRLLSVGIPENQAKMLPINQVLLSEVLGISYIHAHRIFKKLEKVKLVTQKSQFIQLINVEGLLKLSYDKWEIKNSDTNKRIS